MPSTTHGDKTNFDDIAEVYLRSTDKKNFIAYYERPYMLGQLPDLAGKTVLDLGCATGFYSYYALEKGARVISVDASGKMIAHTDRKCDGRNESHVHDLAQPFSFLPDASVDVIVCSLVLHYVERWEPVLAEFYRVLRNDSRCIISTHHPLNDFAHFSDGDYFETRLVEDAWRGFSKPIRVRYFVRPMKEYLRPILETDFHIKAIEEPEPAHELEQVDRRHYEQLMTQPALLFFVLEKGGTQ